MSLRKVYGVWLEKGTEKRQLCLINTTINLQLTSGVEIVDESKWFDNFDLKSPFWPKERKDN